VSARTLRRWRQAIRCCGTSLAERQQVIDAVNDPM
jgi:hypothetical protein